ncbi:hypothetical protein QBC37DRAFT_172347 [Rhypophila decipiens]|uniref:Uncharacterized protein n=1 Tax=Rhypophila decipiens TaxID=261697 RepID=A0AAN7B9T9_9PEZI|nr:hypothetical protein QBC37DRAFT_172347 [Rhypophila decipiens]
MAMELQDLNRSLQTFPIPDSIRRHIEAVFWPEDDEPDPDSDHNLKDRPSTNYYFEAHYSPRCQHYAREGGQHISVKTHSDIAQIAGWILDDATRGAIRVRLLDHATTTTTTSLTPDGEAVVSTDRSKAIETSIDMAANLLAMVECGKQGRFVFSGRNAILWERGESLRSCLGKRFDPVKTTKLDPRNLRLVKGFTGRSLTRIGGIKIKWTTNLVDHLLLTDDDQTVFVFQCAAYLMMQRKSPNKIFPPFLIDETIRTLALLFPQNNSQTKSWLKSQTDTQGKPLDPALGKCGSLRTEERRFENFSFWRDRLIILKEAYDDHRPKTMAQWWFDRRNGEQWYTFWIAVMVFIVAVGFGVIQSVTGILQVVVSYKALEGDSGG